MRAAEAEPFFRIGTGSEAGSEFAVGEVMADLLQAAFGAEDCGLPDCSKAPVLAAAQLSDGSLADLADLRAGRLEAALVDAPAAAWARAGTGPFATDGPIDGLRAVAALYPVLLQVVTLERGGIRGVADLRGRRISLGTPGSGSRAIARRVLAAYGLGEGAFEDLALEPGLALERLAAGRIDAFVALGALPLAAVAQVNEIAAIRLLPVDAERLAEDAELAAMMRSASVPAGTYPGLPAVETIATTEWLVVADDLDADLVYAVAARLWTADAVSRLRAVQPGGFAIERALDPLAVPLHPGAERFYRERGALP